MRRAGPVSRDLATSVKHTENQLCDYVEKSQPGQLGQAENLPRDRDCRANTFCH